MASESPGGGLGKWWAHKVLDSHERDWVWHPVLWFGLGNEWSLVRISERSWFSLTYKSMCSVSSHRELFYIKQDHNLSLTLTKCCECLKITIKMLNIL